MERTQSFCRVIELVTVLLLLGGCATSSLFNPYPNQAQNFQQAIAQPGTPDAVDQVLAKLDDKRTDADAMLYMMERGRIAQLNSRFDVSKTDFELVIDQFERQDLAATVALSEFGAQSGSLLSNDNALPYKGTGYERIFTHHHQAFNYLGQHDLEGAAVEFRKVALEQQVLLEQHDKEVAEAHEAAAEKEIDLDLLAQQFAGLDTIAGSVKSSFQNAYTFYTSAAFWEATGELNSALVDYKKAFEINPDSTLLKQDIARVAKKLGETPDYKDLNEPTPDQGVVVVFFEDGFVPPKSEIKIPIPTYDGGIISLAFPYYQPELWSNSSSLRAMDEQFHELGYSETVVDVAALAVKHLKEQIPGMLVRQTLRAFTKYEMQQQAGKNGGLAGQLFANVYNIVSENADRRSWLTLPQTGQVMRFNLASGSRELNFSTPAAQTKLALEIKPKRTLFVRVVNANNHLLTQVYSL